MPHENLTASSILIDENMIPHLGNCGLGMIRPIANWELQVVLSDSLIQVSS